MIKYLCDTCGDELIEETFPDVASKEGIAKTFTAPNGVVIYAYIRVSTVEGSLSKGELCNDCLVIAITSDLTDEQLSAKRNKVLL